MLFWNLEMDGEWLKSNYVFVKKKKKLGLETETLKKVIKNLFKMSSKKLHRKCGFKMCYT